MIYRNNSSKKEASSVIHRPPIFISLSKYVLLNNYDYYNYINHSEDLISKLIGKSPWNLDRDLLPSVAAAGHWQM